jgi:hypothetical protein
MNCPITLQRARRNERRKPRLAMQRSSAQIADISSMNELALPFITLNSPRTLSCLWYCGGCETSSAYEMWLKCFSNVALFSLMRQFEIGKNDLLRS